MPDKYSQRWTLLFRPDRAWTTNAITVGQTCYYSVPESEVTNTWRRHEDKHKEQWKRGSLKFIAQYLWYSARYGYWGNPLEVEARKAEKAV